MLRTTTIAKILYCACILGIGVCAASCATKLQTRQYRLIPAEWTALRGGAYAETMLLHSDEVIAQEIKSFFEIYGVSFPQGGFVTVDQQTQVIHIRNTRDQLRLIESLMRQ